MDKSEWEALLRGVAEGNHSSKEQLWAYARAVLHASLATLFAGRRSNLYRMGVNLEVLSQTATEKALRLLEPLVSPESLSEEGLRRLLHTLANHTFEDCWRESRGYAGGVRGRTTQSRKPGQQELPGEALAPQDLAETLRRLVAQLPAPEANAIRLFLAGRTHKEIAERLGLTPKYVAVLLSRARRRLRVLLPRDDDLLVPAGGGLSQEPDEIRLTPEQREWALRQFSEEEVVAGLRELREKGGLELKDFLPELERIVEDGCEPTK